jgi:hypothetical protein
MSIKSRLTELESINKELKRLSDSRKKLNKRKKEIEAFILEYLENNQQEALKYKGTLIRTKQKTLRPRKKAIDKKNDCERILEKYGITNKSQILEELSNAMKGEAKMKKELKLTSI